MATSSASRGTSVYVHFPFCARRCPYCDFATIARSPSEVPGRAYTGAVLRELEARSRELEGRRLTSIFFGGGTPSLWDPEELGRVREAIVRTFASHDEDVEITVECNPTSLDRAKVEALAAAGVNRLSIGVQSLDDERLRFLGRLHDRRGALRALEAARETFERVSADFIFGLPGQGPRELLGELDELRAFDLEHLSLYALTIEEGTPFHDLKKQGRLPIATDEAYASVYLGAEDALGALGYEHYEVSNYAKPGHASLHNAHYWRGHAYLGLGAAAVGCLDEGVGRAVRRKNVVAPDAYLEDPLGAPAELETLGAEELLREALMLGLRTSVGVDVADVRARTGLDVLTARARPIARRLERGELVVENGRLRVPHERWLSLDAIVLDLF
jgi:putative oxygen-independent coproporphyrinogen III oxidase